MSFMNKTLYDRIKNIYPELQNADFRDTIRLQNDSDNRGDYIHTWNHPTLARPTNEQLNEVTQ